MKISRARERVAYPTRRTKPFTHSGSTTHYLAWYQSIQTLFLLTLPALGLATQRPGDHQR